jgi:hypothetical protein
MVPTACSPTRRLRRRLVVAAAGAGCLAWSVGVVAGVVSLGRFGAEPGVLGAAPRQWPSDCEVELDPAVPTLVVFAHPHCPCTAATLRECERILGKCAGRIAPRVVFFADPELGRGWERTASWERAERMPGVRVSSDPGGGLARRFGAATSGSTVLYAPDGRLLFHGGITGARGHEGDNAGAGAIVDLVCGGVAALPSTAVYGCSLVTPAAGRGQ